MKKQKITIHVTEEHIKRGTRHTCTECPIALAVKDAFPTMKYVSVGGSIITSETNEPYERFARFTIYEMTPRAAFSFVEKFDQGDDVEPFSFEFEYQTIVR